MISWSSSFASSTPATSLNVTFFCVLDESFARLLPNERALFPPLCICRMMKIQKPIISRIGAQEYSSVAHGLVVSGLAVDRDALLVELVGEALVLRRRRTCGTCSLPLPVVARQRAGDLVAGDRDRDDLARLRRARGSAENGIGARSRAGSVVENFQIRTPTTTRTIQNSKLLRVEFNLGLLTALLSRVSRLVRAP